jgi:hypothetical protein
VEYFSLQAWVDFARAARPDSSIVEMARHRACCDSCHRQAMMVEDAIMSAECGQEFTPPDEVLAHALRIFDQNRPAATPAPTLPKRFEG